MNKVAICFYGNLRNYDHTMEGLLKFFGRECDYFMSTSDIAHDDLWGVNDHQVTPPIIEDIFNGYKLKNYKIYDSNYISDELSGRLVMGLAPPILWKYALALKTEHELKHNFEYDIVALVRPDLVIGYHNSPPLTKCNTNYQWIFTDNTITQYSPTGALHTNDLCVIGTNAVMNMLSDVYSHTMIMGLVNCTFYTAEFALSAFMAKYNLTSLPNKWYDVFMYDEGQYRCVFRELEQRLGLWGNTSKTCNYTVPNEYITKLRKNKQPNHNRGRKSQ